MSREYVERRLSQIAVQHAVDESIAVDGEVVLWSLDGGCWMLLDPRRGIVTRLQPVTVTGDSSG